MEEVARDVEAASHERLVVAQLPAGATRASIDFDNSIRLEGWEAPAQMRRGERARVVLYFRCLHAIEHDWRIFVHGDSLSNSEAPRIALDHFPGRDADSTRQWKEGELVRDECEISIPTDYSAREVVL